MNTARNQDRVGRQVADIDRKRAAEILQSMTAFSKNAYHKSEYLLELSALEKEAVRLTFSGESDKLTGLQLKNVESRLEQLNEELGGVATESLLRFKPSCDAVVTEICAERSGNKGESKAFDYLGRVKTRNTILRNVELTADIRRTEIDAAVVTSKGIFIVEVKNPSKNIFIDDDGNYYRTGQYQRLDCNIVEKMSLRESLLREALQAAGVSDPRIFGLVVFTNNWIEVKNRCPNIKTCFLGQLPYFIDEHEGEHVYDDDAQDRIAEAIEGARTTEAYPVKAGIQRFKEDFAEVMARLESASAAVPETIEPVEEKTAVVVKRREAVIRELLSAIFNSKRAKAGANIAAAVALFIMTTMRNN